MRDRNLPEGLQYSKKINKNGWPAIYHFIRIIGMDSKKDAEVKDQFLDELSRLFDQLQEKFDSLPEENRKACGQKGIAVDIVFNVNMQKKEVILNRIYKYCNLDIHIFKELSQMLCSNFPDYVMTVPALEGYQLAEEINRHLGDAEIECIYLKGDEEERLLIGKNLQWITFESILKDTKQHYSDLGGIEKKEAETRCGLEISMYHRSDEGEEEVLWMQVKVPIQKHDSCVPKRNN